jgi:NAD(P)-dependent dehydrogenase (short-subunit alcohol dehydrogenase family)
MLSEKVALVTGAASGLGKATAKLLASSGARVVATDINAEALDQVVDEIEASGGNALAFTHDVTNEAQWREAIELAATRWERLDILVNNAGISMFSLVTDLSFENWRKCIAIDLDSVFLGTKYALPLMRQGGGGSIVNISSMAGIVGFSNLSAYCAAKGGVRLFTKAVALECAALKDGVRVNSIHPGIIATPIFDTVSADASVRVGAVGNGQIDVTELANQVVPLGVPGRAEDIAQAVLYLASDASAYVTGTELVVDGGVCAA